MSKPMDIRERVERLGWLVEAISRLRERKRLGWATALADAVNEVAKERGEDVTFTEEAIGTFVITALQEVLLIRRAQTKSMNTFLGKKDIRDKTEI